MISILSILVFMLVQGHVVCDRELYPVAMFRIDADERPSSDLPENGKNGFPQGNSEGERRAMAPVIDADVMNLKTRIADAYGFVKDPNKNQWKTLPSFEGQIGKRGWAAAARLAEQFFRGNNGREKPWEHLLQTRTPINLLYITAARYLFVTHILWVESDGNLIPCKEKRNKYDGLIQSLEIPANGVCFPLPYGSATYKSDYDVGLIGIDSGTVTQSFNQYFQAAPPDGFGKPSELVFDTNVYAFTLEFAMPTMFLKLPVEFAEKVGKLEMTVKYKMQELASAYYKVFKYSQDFYTLLKDSAENNLEAAPWRVLNRWLTSFGNLNAAESFRKGPDTSDHDFRLAHNNQYQAFVAAVSQNGGYVPNMIDNVVKALLYAAEAYHTRGAIRHVVQATQMKAISTAQFQTPLSTYDLWVSMIENWGDANKEYQHCGPNNLLIAACLNKMSKYLARMFNAMRLVRLRIPGKEQLLAFGTTDDPEAAALLWRRKGQEVEAKSYFMFLTKFQCGAMVDVQAQAPVADQALSINCMGNIHMVVNAYNAKLAALVTNRDRAGL